MITLKALKNTGIRAVIQAEQIPQADRVNTDRLYFIGAVPYSYIFKKVRAVVHHGGNTTNVFTKEKWERLSSAGITCLDYSADIGKAGAKRSGFFRALVIFICSYD